LVIRTFGLCATVTEPGRQLAFAEYASRVDSATKAIERERM
jgi:hypothetical protein